MPKTDKKKVLKTNVKLEKLQVEYVPIDAIHPNPYNPNRQSDFDFELLLKSMGEDGFTQPIVVQKANNEIVDGEHRWKAAKELNFTEIPVVYVDMTPEQMRIATLRHNRARGSEDVELTAQVLRDLRELGALDWAQDSLMLDDEEINRLIEDINIPDILAGDEYTQAWVPTQATQDEMGASTQKMAIDGGDAAATTNALEAMRQREQRIKEAKSQEERELIVKEREFYRVILTFANDEAVIVKAVLGESPAEKMYALCLREYQEMQKEQ